MTMGVTMLGTAEVVILAGGELRPAGRGSNKEKTNRFTLTALQNALCIETKMMQRYTDSNSPIGRE